MPGFEVLFEGSKVFPKVKKTLNVTVVEHTIFDVIEVIVFNEPAAEQLESRLYIDTEVLALKTGLIGPDGEMKNFDPSCNIKIAQKKMKYIVDRLSATKYSEENKILDICMQFTFQDRDEDFESGVEADSMVIERPDALFPYKRPQLQYLLSDKCTSVGSNKSSKSNKYMSLHRDSLAMVPRFSKPKGPRTLIPASTFSAPGNAALTRAFSEVNFSAAPKRALSGLQPVAESVRKVLGFKKGASAGQMAALHISVGAGASMSSPISQSAPVSPGYSSTSTNSAASASASSSSKKAGRAMLSLSSHFWTSLSTLGTSMKLGRSAKVIPGCPTPSQGQGQGQGSEHGSGKDDSEGCMDHSGHSGLCEKFSAKTDDTCFTSPNRSPLPSQRATAQLHFPTIPEQEQLQL